MLSYESKENGSCIRDFFSASLFCTALTLVIIVSRLRRQAVVQFRVLPKTNCKDSEKRVIEKQWAKRDKQIEKVVLNIAGMHGDLEGIAGTSLPAIKMLELPSDEQQESVTEEIK